MTTIVTQNTQTVTRQVSQTERRTGTREVTSGEPAQTRTVEYTYTVQVMVTETEIVVTTEVQVIPDPAIDAATQDALEAELEAELSSGVLDQIYAEIPEAAAAAVQDGTELAALEAFVDTAAPSVATTMATRSPLGPDGVVDATVASPFLDAFEGQPGGRTARASYGLALTSEDELAPVLEPDALSLGGPNGVAQERMRVYAADPTAENWDAYVRAVAVAQAEGVRDVLSSDLASLETAEDWEALVDAAGGAVEAADFLTTASRLEAEFAQLRALAQIADPSWSEVTFADVMDGEASMEQLTADASWGRQQLGWYPQDGRLDRRLDVVSVGGGASAELYLDGAPLTPGTPGYQRILDYAGVTETDLQGLAYNIAQYELGGFPADAGNPEADFLASVQAGFEREYPPLLPPQGDPMFFQGLDAFTTDVAAFRADFEGRAAPGVTFQEARAAAGTILQDILTEHPALSVMDPRQLVARFGQGTADLRFERGTGGLVGGLYDDIADPGLDPDATSPFADRVLDRIGEVDALIDVIQSDEATAADLLFVNQAALDALASEALLSGDAALLDAVEGARAHVAALRAQSAQDQQRDALIDTGLAVVAIVAGVAAIPATGGASLFLAGASLTATVVSSGRAVDDYLEARRLSGYNATGLNFSGIDRPSDLAFGIEMALNAAGGFADAFMIARALRSASTLDDLARLGASADDLARLQSYADDLESAARLVSEVGTSLDEPARLLVAREIADPTLAYGELSQVTRQFLADHMAIVPRSLYEGAGMVQDPDRLLLVMRERQLRGLSDEQIVANAADGRYAAHGVETADDATQLLAEYYTRGPAAQFGSDIVMSVGDDLLRDPANRRRVTRYIQAMRSTDSIPGAVPFRPGDGFMTPDEMNAIQAAVDSAGEPLAVYGSRARGQGRNVYTSLPNGKGPGTRSDFDIAVVWRNLDDIRNGSTDFSPFYSGDPMDLAQAAEDLQTTLGTHLDIFGGLPASTDLIIFRPGQPPVRVWPGYFDGAARPDDWS